MTKIRDELTPATLDPERTRSVADSPPIDNPRAPGFPQPDRATLLVLLAFTASDGDPGPDGTIPRREVVKAILDANDPVAALGQILNLAAWIGALHTGGPERLKAFLADALELLDLYNDDPSA